MDHLRGGMAQLRVGGAAVARQVLGRLGEVEAPTANLGGLRMEQRAEGVGGSCRALHTQNPPAPGSEMSRCA